MEKKLQKISFTYYNLLIAQGLWQANIIIFLKEFMKLNAKSDMKTKNMKKRGIKYKYSDYFLEYTNFENYLIEYKCQMFLL